MNKRIPIIGSLGLVLALFLAWMNLQYGNLNQDEGWYCYAAKMVSRGHSPYKDFAFTQGPVLPQVYSVLFPVIGKFGVAGGRFITVVFGLLAALCAGLAAAKNSKNGRIAWMAAFLLITGNVYQSYFTTVVKTYALTAFFLMAGFYLLSYRHKATLILGGAALALAAGTRLSAGIVLPITGIWLILQKERKLDWLWFGLGGGLMLLAIYAPPFIQSPEQARFGLLGYHAGRDPGGMGKIIMLKVGFISRFVQAYLIFTVLTLAALCFQPLEKKVSPFAMLMWLCGIGISAVHALAAFPYDDYQVIAFPMLAVALVLTLLPKIEEKWQAHALTFLLLASVAASFSSPVNQEWFVRGRDRIWWQFKEKSDLAVLRDVAQIVKQNSPEGSELLTQDAYLAVEANRSVPRGMEMGPFCYYPEMSREQAEKFHLLNREMLIQTLKNSTAPVAAISGYGLAIESPAIAPVPAGDLQSLQQALLIRFKPIKDVVPYFGQGHTPITIYSQTDSK